MAVCEALRNLREEFVVRAAQSARERYAREAQYLTDSQLGTRCAQLAVTHRRLAREVMEATARGISSVPPRQLLLVRDMEVQKDAFEMERSARSAHSQQVAVSA